MDETTEESSWVEGTGNSLPSRLCPACLSVVTRSNLEHEKLYPHHSSPKALIEAANMQCYICSWLISCLRVNEYEGIKQVAGLKQLAENEVPGGLVAAETNFEVLSEDELDSEWNNRMECDESESWISFTDMGLAWALEGNSRKVHAQLNPSYEHYIPPHLSAFSRPIKVLWMMIQSSFYFGSIKLDSPVLVPQEGMPILALTLRGRPFSHQT